MLLRPPFRQWIVGNWKMYKTSQEAKVYWDEFLPYLQTAQVDVGLAVPFTLIATAVSSMEQTSLVIGAQNMHDAREGAFTGEIAARMLVDVGAKFVILGHSERRTLFGETDAWIHKKVLRALESHLHVILCVGESLEAHEADKTNQVLEQQVNTALEGLSAEQFMHVTLAYEPIWAVGSGQPATAEKIQEVHLFLRKLIAQKVGPEAASQLYILYGGSVQTHNAENLLAQSQVDGLLIGGSSLSPALFGKIIHAAPQLQAREQRRPFPLVEEVLAPLPIPVDESASTEEPIPIVLVEESASVEESISVPIDEPQQQGQES